LGAAGAFSSLRGAFRARRTRARDPVL